MDKILLFTVLLALEAIILIAVDFFLNGYNLLFYLFIVLILLLLYIPFLGIILLTFAMCLFSYLLMGAFNLQFQGLVVISFFGLFALGVILAFCWYKEVKIEMASRRLI